MKKIKSLLAVLTVTSALVLTISGCAFFGNLFGGGPQDEIYVATRGNDSNTGSGPPNPVQTLAAAIGRVNDGGTIYITEGTHTVTDNTYINKNVTIEGGYTEDFTSISGLTVFEAKDYYGQILTISGGNIGKIVSISNMKIQNSFDKGNGSAIGIYEISETSLTNCTFTGNAVYGAGGAIAVHDSSLQCASCSFDGNTSFYNPSTIFLFKSDGIFENCTFDNNVVRDNYLKGQVIQQTTDTAQPTSFKDCVFTNNPGRAFYSSGGVDCYVDLGGNIGMLPPIEDALVVYSGWAGGIVAATTLKSGPTVNGDVTTYIYANTGETVTITMAVNTVTGTGTYTYAFDDFYYVGYTYNGSLAASYTASPMKLSYTGGLTVSGGEFYTIELDYSFDGAAFSGFITLDGVYIYSITDLLG